MAKLQSNMSENKNIVVKSSKFVVRMSDNNDQSDNMSDNND